MNANLITAITNVLYGVIGAALLMLFTHWIYPTKSIAVVNLTGLVDGYVKGVAKENIPKKLAAQQVRAFAHELENAVKKMSKDKNVVIMPAEAVIAGSQNLTNELVNKMPVLKDLIHTKHTKNKQG